MPVLRTSVCSYADQYEATVRRGFRPSQSYPCRKCPIGPKQCPYLTAFSTLEDADQLCCAAIYHTHDDFYLSHDNEDRPIVIFDENSIDLILEPVVNSVAQWKNWADMMRRCGEEHHDQGQKYVKPFLKLAGWLETIEQKFLHSEEDPKFHHYALPDDLHFPDLKKASTISTVPPSSSSPRPEATSS